MTSGKTKAIHSNAQSVRANDFSCPICRHKAFRSLKALRDHQKSKNHWPFACTKCEKRFLDASGLSQHEGKHNKPKMTPKSPPATSAKGPTSQKSPEFHSSEKTLVSRGADCIVQAFSIDAAPFIHQPFGYPFAALEPLEQDLIFKYLLARCHSLDRLQVQGYTMPAMFILTNKCSHKGVPHSRHIRSTQPKDVLKREKRKAIVIDCEMVQARHNPVEVAFLSAIDFLTGEVLISSYVEPTSEVLDWKFNISGITPAAMSAAISKGEALRGFHGARQALWEHADEETVLIGHFLHHDLKALHMVHSRVVDSAILTGEAVFLSLRSTQPLRRLWSLKILAKDLLNCDIQAGHAGHNALEDAFATREIVIWCLQNPECLKAWAEKAWEEFDAEQKRRNSRTHKKGGGKATNAKGKEKESLVCLSELDFDDCLDILGWSDIADDYGWPHPDTGYDPWSD